MAGKEAKAKIKINKLLEEAGWRFFDSEDGKATIKMESSIKMEDMVCQRMIFSLLQPSSF